MAPTLHSKMVKGTRALLKDAILRDLGWVSQDSMKHSGLHRMLFYETPRIARTGEGEYGRLNEGAGN